MRKVYSALAWIIAGGVVVQAASVALGVGGMMHFVQEGGVIDKALVESRQATFEGVVGFPIHGIVGGMVIPIVALLLLIVSFFVRVRGAKLWALVVLVLVALQITLGYSITDLPYLGLIHGANALAVLLIAVMAALRVGRRPRTEIAARSPEGVTDALAA